MGTTDILISYFLIKRVYTSINKIKESENIDQIVEKIGSQFSNSKIEGKSYLCKRKRENIKIFMLEPVDSGDVKILKFILRFSGEESNKTEIKNFIKSSHDIIFSEDNYSPFSLINRMKKDKLISNTRRYFISNPFILLSTNYEENRNNNKIYQDEIEIRNDFFSIFSRSKQYSKIFVLNTEEDGKSKEVNIYGALDTVDDEPQVKYHKILFYVNYPKIIENAVSCFVIEKLPKVYLSLKKIEYEIHQFELSTLTNDDSQKVNENEYKKDKVNLIGTTLDKLEKQLLKFEENKYYIFQIPDEKIKELGKAYVDAAEYAEKSKGYYATITRHYKAMNNELDINNRRYNKKNVSIVVKKESEWFNIINSKFSLKTKCNNIESAIKYIDIDFGNLKTKYEYFNYLLQFHYAHPPDLIVTGKEEKNAYMYMQTLGEINLYFMPVKVDNASSKEKILNMFLNSFIDKKEYTKELIKTISSDFTRYIMQNNNANMANLPYSVVENSKTLKIKDEKNWKSEYNLLLMALKRIYFSNLEECDEIKNATNKEIADILLLSAENENAISLYRVAFEEYQKNKEFDKVEKILSFILKDNTKNNKINPYKRSKGSFKSFFIKTLLWSKTFKYNQRKEKIKREEENKTQSNTDSSTEKRLKEFAFNYYMNRYDIYNAINLAKNDHSIQIPLILNAISYSWSSQSKSVTKLILTLLVCAVLVLSPMYGFKGYPITLSHVSVAANIVAIILILFTITTFIFDAVKNGISTIKRLKKQKKIKRRFEVNFDLGRIFLPRLLGAIIVGTVGSIMADIDWTVINNSRYNSVAYYFWIFIALLGSLCYFYYRTSEWYNEKIKAWRKAITTLSIGFLYSYIFSIVFVGLIAPLKFKNGELLCLNTEFNISSGVLSKIVNLISKFYFPYYILFFASVSLFLGAALQLLWSKEQVTEEL